MMHVAANTDYAIHGFVYETVIPSFTNFVFLFMTISAFEMCCGYYDKVMNNTISFSDFYAKRFKKILPFFALLVILDLVMSPSINSLYEGFADLTLLFGFLPNAGNISVIGVGWFLGLIFVFYLIFPFFCVLLGNKRRAWLSFGINILYNFVCIQYFDVSRSNILYSAPFFLAGGLLYLYKDELLHLKKWVMPILVVLSVVLYYVLNGNVYMCLLVSITLTAYAILSGGGLLQNRITKFFSDISMEMYLSHMVMFKLVEKAGLLSIAGNGVVQYVVSVVLVVAAAVAFSLVVKKGISIVDELIRKKRRELTKEV